MSDSIIALQAENARLRAALAQSSQASGWEREVALCPNLRVLSNAQEFSDVPAFQRVGADSVYNPAHQLSAQEIARFSRHQLVPEVGVARQDSWLRSSVLVVGAGGLAATAAQYQAAAGIGRLTLIDDDVVEESNLQRQVIHSERTLGAPKAVSAGIACAQRAGGAEIVSIVDRFTPSNSAQLVAAHDVIVDATDNVFTRYLINDTAVVCGKPVVSGSSLRMEGQLTVYHHNEGPCYRCLFPRPPPAETVTNCSDGGVLGVIPGTIGMLQALEALKVLGKAEDCDILTRRLLLFDGASSTFRTVKLRGRNPECAVCGDHPTIDKQSQTQYESVCMAVSHDKVVPSISNSAKTAATTTDVVRQVSPDMYHEHTRHNTAHLLLDVRDTHQYNICQLPRAVNYPFTKMLPRTMSRLRSFLWEQYKIILGPEHYQQAIKDAIETTTIAPSLHTVTICRRGVYSTLACTLQQHQKQQKLPSDQLHSEDQVVLHTLPPLDLFNYTGGITRYQQTVDSTFPLY